jgi:hypothetical protein
VNIVIRAEASRDQVQALLALVAFALEGDAILFVSRCSKRSEGELPYGGLSMRRAPSS